LTTERGSPRLARHLNRPIFRLSCCFCGSPAWRWSTRSAANPAETQQPSTATSWPPSLILDAIGPRRRALLRRVRGPACSRRNRARQAGVIASSTRAGQSRSAAGRPQGSALTARGRGAPHSIHEARLGFVTAAVARPRLRKEQKSPFCSPARPAAFHKPGLARVSAQNGAAVSPLTPSLRRCGRRIRHRGSPWRTRREHGQRSPTKSPNDRFRGE
jgi:hypothetical protein